MRNMLRLSLLMVAGMLATPLLAQPTVYVSTTGDDANPGTEAEPFATIATAIDEVDVGGTIFVEPGEYIIIGSGPDSTPGIAINKSLTLAGTDPENIPEIVFQDLPGSGFNAQVGIRITASNVTVENISFEQDVSASDDSQMFIIPAGSAPTYNIIHDNIVFRNVVFDGARRAIFSHASNLVVEDSTFRNQSHPNIQIRTMSCNLVVRNNTFIGIPSFNDRQAVIFEGFGDLPPVTGTILIEGNVMVNKNQGVLFSQWNSGGTEGSIDFFFRHNTLQSLESRGVIFFAGPVQDPNAFARFGAIDISDNIFSNVARGVYVDYSDFGGVDDELKPVPSDGQIVLRNNSRSGLGAVGSTETATGTNLVSFRNGIAPSGASTAMFDEAAGVAAFPNYANPGDLGDGDVSLNPASNFIGASSTGATIGAWQNLESDDTIYVVADINDVPDGGPTAVKTTSLGEAALVVNRGGTVILPSEPVMSSGAWITKEMSIVGGDGIGATELVGSADLFSIRVLPSAGTASITGSAFAPVAVHPLSGWIYGGDAALPSISPRTPLAAIRWPSVWVEIQPPPSPATPSRDPICMTSSPPAR